MTVSDDDDLLMTQLRDAVHERATVTDRAREAARAAFSWRTIDEELLELVHDSAAEELLVRGFATPRVFGFQGPDLNLEVEFDSGVLSGQVVPGRACQLTIVLREAAPVLVDTDETGFFSVPFESRGTVRFVLDTEDGPVSTGWISL